MILGQRKNQEQDQEKNWCVVLNPLESEIDRKRMASKIAEVFSISVDEAQDLVRSTPIILLDHLTKVMAEKIKDFFSPLHADLILSKDTLFKRKCYRTLWPQPPSLSFLHQMDDSSKANTHRPAMTPDRIHEPLHPEHALDEIRRSLVQDQDLKKPAAQFSSRKEQEKPKSEPSKKTAFDDISYASIFEQEKPKEVAQSAFKPVVHSTPTVPPVQVPVLQATQEKELKDIRTTLQNVETRYEALKGEYRDARNLFEDKISQTRMDNDSLKKRIEEVLSGYQELQKERQKWTADFSEKESAFIKAAEASKNAFERWDREFLRIAKEVENLNSKFTESVSRLELLETGKQKLEKSFAEQQTSLESLRVHFQAMEKNFEKSLERELEEKKLRENLEQKLRSLESAQQTFKREIGSEARQLVQTEFQGLNFDKKFDSFQDVFQKQYEMLESILKHLIVRESQRGLIDAPSVAEASQEESLRPRVSAKNPDQEKYLAARLGDKESILKRLVSEQEKIEKDIQEREEEMRRVIVEQERIEKEIMEVRQTQRQWTSSDKYR